MARWVLSLTTIILALVPFSQPISAVEGGPGNCRRAMTEWYGGQPEAEKVLGHEISDSQNKALQSAILVSGSARKLLILLRAGFTPADARLLDKGEILRYTISWNCRYSIFSETRSVNETSRQAECTLIPRPLWSGTIAVLWHTRKYKPYVLRDASESSERCLRCAI